MDATTRPASNRRRWITLIVVCFAMLMNTLDQTIVNVALPAIQHDLAFSQTNLAWVVDAYLIAFGGSLLLAGRLGDLVGRKKVFLAGVALFTLASVAGGLAETQPVLIAARFIQGLGAALSSSAIIAIIVTEFPDAAERTRAMSAYIIVAVGGGSIGLLLGGALTEWLSWHWNFFINLPIGVATLVAGSLLIAENEGLGLGEGLDIAGSILVTAGLMTGIYAVVTSEQAGWGSAHTLGLGAAAVVLLAGFLMLQARLSNPIMPLRIFRSRGLLSSSGVRGLTFVGIYAVFFLGALYLEHIRRYDTIRTGLAFLPFTLAVLALSLGATARVMGRLGTRRTALVGLMVILAGLLFFARTGEHTSYFPFLFAGFLLVGLGGGTLFTPLLTIAVADVPAQDAGLASGIVNVSQNVSAAFGVALLGTISSGHSRLLLSHGYPALAALTAGYRFGFGFAAACAAGGLVLALLALREMQAAAPAQDYELPAAA
ncbi:MAG: DHA2 family efflux MFS transporter permease subunit [Chloroflexota bacterium]|nr:DHA2 family efflux MFS transporter permease subunit [Chloroflexota bacterium]